MKILNLALMASMLLHPVFAAAGVRLRPLSPIQGKAMRVELQGTLARDAREGMVAFESVEVPIFAYSGKVMAVVPIPMGEATGTHILSILYLSPQRGEFGSEVVRRNFRFSVRPRRIVRDDFCNQIATAGDNELKERIVRETARFLEIFSRDSRLEFRSRYFWYPLPRVAINSHFGERRYCHGNQESVHNGVDLAGELGDDVRAPAAGVVVEARHLTEPGNFVMLDHGSGIKTVYAHLSRITVRRGAWVRAGAKIGEIGTTGNSSGPHLHWGAMIAGVYVDPISLFAAFH